MLKVNQVSFSYPQKPVLEKIDFSLKEGEIVALIGASGSGKTTLFRLITGLIDPQSGTICMDHKSSYMQQEDLLLPWRTVMGNLLLFTKLGKQTNKGDFKTKALELLGKVGLKESAHLYPHELSGGMRQRVSLARALLQNGQLLLLDEPFGSLDLIIREQLYLLIRNICNQEKKGIMLITHDFRDALSIADRILILKKGKINQHYAIDQKLRTDPVASEQLMQQIRAQL